MVASLPLYPTPLSQLQHSFDASVNAGVIQLEHDTSSANEISLQTYIYTNRFVAIRNGMRIELCPNPCCKQLRPKARAC